MPQLSEKTIIIIGLNLYKVSNVGRATVAER